MINSKIIVIDDEPSIVRGCHMILSEHGYCVETSTSGREGLKKLLNNSFDLALLDIAFPHINGIDILKVLKKENIDVAVIIMTGNGTVTNAVEAMKGGAFDFITKPFSEEQLVCNVVKALESIKLVKENLSLKKQLHDKFNFSNIIGDTPEIKEIFHRIERVAPMDSTVLLNGESGTGKELFANSIHVRSTRASGRFLAVDCNTFSSTLMESELFGHVKGAFTGADANKTGIFGAADGGPFFWMRFPIWIWISRESFCGCLRPESINLLDQARLYIRGQGWLRQPTGTLQKWWKRELSGRICFTG